MGNWLDWGAAVLLLLPLLYFTWVGYERSWWWRLNSLEILPFPSPLAVRSSFGMWFLVCWAFILLALLSSIREGTGSILAVLFVLVELGYALLSYREERPESPEPSVIPIMAFGLWHNGLMEELLFRGLPLLLLFLLGADSTMWMYMYIGGTSLLFGLYHWVRVHPIRFWDTTAFGVVLGAVAWKYGLPEAILLHLAHNSLAIPLYRSNEAGRRWWKSKQVYVAGLTVLALITFLQ